MRGIYLVDIALYILHNVPLVRAEPQIASLGWAGQGEQEDCQYSNTGYCPVSTVKIIAYLSELQYACTGNQKVAGSNPAGSTTCNILRTSMKATRKYPRNHDLLIAEVFFIWRSIFLYLL